MQKLIRSGRRSINKKIIKQVVLNLLLIVVERNYFSVREDKVLAKPKRKYLEENKHT
jgi:hypothetical protein